MEHHIRALIIEDNPAIVENITDFLEAKGYILDFAMDGIGGLHLALTQENVVSKKDMENSLWGDMPPGSDVLRSHIYTLRKKIDKPFDHARIETVHGMGFRLKE